MTIEKETKLPKTPEEFDKAAKQAIADIEKAHGKGSVIDMSAKVGEAFPHIATGVFDVDNEVLGIGGFPRGRISEIFGAPSSGKTTLTLMTIASAQRAGLRCAFIDVENALDPTYADALGVDVAKLIVSQPDHGEQALDILSMLIDSAAFGLIIVDSVAALVPKAELEGDPGQSHMGLQARLMSQGCRRIAGPANRTNTSVIFINQLRDKIGVVFGNPSTTTGGKALPFYCSVRLEVQRTGSNKDGEEVVSNKTKIKCVKNKLAPPFRSAEVTMEFGTGIDKDGSLLEAAVRYGVVTKSGSWYSYQAERMGQGSAQASTYVAERRQEILSKTLEARNNQGKA